MLSEVLSKMLKKTVSADLNFEQVWREMEEIEPLTPDINLERYKCGKRSDVYMFEDADDKLLFDS